MKKFKVHIIIKKLFDVQDINLKLIHNFNVIIGENGCGKTTLLKIINAIVDRDYNLLVDIPFKEVSLKINKNKVIINKSDLEELDFTFYPTFRFFIKELDFNAFNTFEEFFEFLLMSKDKITNWFFSFKANNHLPLIELLEEDNKIFERTDYVDKMSTGKYPYGSKIYLEHLYLYFKNESFDKYKFENIQRAIFSTYVDLDNNFSNFQNVSLKSQHKFCSLIKNFIDDKKFSIINNDLITTKKDTNEFLKNELLSSGEKKLIQVLKFISISDDSIIMLDEPELSLSYKWHEKLINLLIDESKERLFIIATQIPMLQNNEDLKYIAPLILNRKSIKYKITKRFKDVSSLNDKTKDEFKDFFEEFLNRVENKNLSNIIAEYISQINFSKNFVFLEGQTDINFYTYCINKLFGIDRAHFISCSGKNKVISSLNYLMSNDLLNDKRHFHIVDRDFDELNGYDIEYNDNLFMTKYYSFENYAFMKENIGIIFNYFNLPEDEIKNILKLLQKYANEILDFETIRYLNSNTHFNYYRRFPKTNKKNPELSDFLIVGDGLKMNKLLKDHINNIISRFNPFQERTYNLQKEILKENFLLYNGHDLSLFFDLYLANKYGQDFKIDNILSKKEIIEQLNIILDNVK